MKYNQLGRTGLFVSEICLGTMTFGSSDSGRWKSIGGVGQQSADKIMAQAIAAGVNFIDTSNNYSFGESEKIVGQGLKTWASLARTWSLRQKFIARRLICLTRLAQEFLTDVRKHIVTAIVALLSIGGCQ